MPRFNEIHEIQAKSRKSRKASTNTYDPKSSEGFRIGRIVRKPYEKAYKKSSRKIDHEGGPRKKGFHEQADKSP